MKKLLALIIATILVLACAGCSSGETVVICGNCSAKVLESSTYCSGCGALLFQNNVNTPNASSPASAESRPTQGAEATEPKATEAIPSGKFNEATVLSQLEVTEYAYSSSWYQYGFLAIKNNSNFDLDLSVSVKFYDASGNLIGANTKSQEAFESGTEILLYFMPDEEFARMEYEFSADKEDWYECVVSDLTYESVSAKNKEIVSVTNNGEKPAEFVEVHALFFKGGKVVGHNSTYFTDDDYELKPGKTITEELSCYEDYDSVKFFFTGRR